MRVILLFVGVPLCFVLSSEGRQEGVHHLLNDSWLRLGGVVSPSSAVTIWKEGPKLVRTSTGDGCLLLFEPRASDLKPLKMTESPESHSSSESTQKKPQDMGWPTRLRGSTFCHTVAGDRGQLQLEPNATNGEGTNKIAASPGKAAGHNHESTATLVPSPSTDPILAATWAWPLPRLTPLTLGAWPQKKKADGANPLGPILRSCCSLLHLFAFTENDLWIYAAFATRNRWLM